MMSDLRQQILKALTQAHQTRQLDAALTPAIFPPFAEALEPVIRHYRRRVGQFPDATTFQTIANNFNSDGPRVQLLHQVDHPQAIEQWEQVRQSLLLRTQRQCLNLPPADQVEIVADTIRRLQKTLSTFEFRASLKGWTISVWLNECRRRGARVKKERQRRQGELPLDHTNLDEVIAQAGSGPVEAVEKRLVLSALWARIELLAGQPDTLILRLHFQNYTLQDIQAELDSPPPALSTIKRRKDRLLKRLAADDELRQFAVDLGIVPDKEESVAKNPES